MDTNEIKNILINHLNLDEVYVVNDDKHYQIIAVSNQFFGMTTLQKHKIIYAPLMQYILDSCIHSVSIKAFTQEEWQYECKLFIR